MSVFADLALLDVALARVGIRATAVRASVEADAGAIAGVLATAEANADAIGQAVNRLTDQIATGSKVWSEELQLALDLIEVSGLRIDDFLLKWGSAVVQTENGAETIRQAFNKLDVRGREQEIQELILAIRGGADGVTEALEFLAGAQGKYADELRKTVEAVRQGKAPIEKLLLLVKQIQTQFGGTAFAELADALADAARQGDFS